MPSGPHVVERAAGAPVGPAPPEDLTAELERRLQQQAAVAALGQSALAGASFEDLLEEVVRVCQVHLGVDLVGYLHCTPDPGTVQALAGVGWSGDWTHDGRLIPVVPGGLTDVALRRAEPLSFDDLRHAGPSSPVLLEAGVSSSLVVPIIGQRPIGVIGVHSRAPRHFNAHDAAFLSAAGNVVAVAHRRLEAEADTRYRALHDSLTGLPNRVLLHDRLERVLIDGRRRRSTSAMLLMDLDGFKQVNDTLGHGVGDELLKAVARRLRSSLRQVDTVARLGGDEFAVILPEVGGLDAARRVAAKLLRALEEPLLVAGTQIPIMASVGVVVAPEHGDDVDVLLQRADLAMYRAKRLSSGVEAYENEADGAERERMTLAADLRLALERDELTLFYQPKVSLVDGSVVGVEALVRWHHPVHGLLPPGAFVPLVEPTGLVVNLSKWVVARAAEDARRWADQGLDLVVAVNCSARWVQNTSMADYILEVLAASGVPARQLVAEVTESALLSNPSTALANMEALVAAGVRVSIDDFGTGFSSLSLLERLPATEIKIDRGFVDGLDETSGGAGGPVSRRGAIVRSVLELGRALHISVVAEGVETEAALRALQGLGCVVAQGYLMARPAPADAVPGLVADRPWRALFPDVTPAGGARTAAA